MVIKDKNIDKIKESIENISVDKRVFICGVMPLGRYLSNWFDREGIVYEAFVDRQGVAKWTDKKVYRYEELKTTSLNGIVFIVTQVTSKFEVIEELRDLGVTENSIITFESMVVFDVICNDLKKDISTSKVLDTSWKNIHKGKRCFVVGNGPSLRKEDLIKLNGEYTFSMNMIYKNLDKIGWRPSYYVVTDRTMGELFWENDEEFEMLLKNVDTAFFDIKTDIFDEYANSEINNLFFFKTIETGYTSIEEGERYFSEDVVKGLYRAGTVTFVALQLACYFGFDEIYLLGVDFSYKNEKHFDGRRVSDVNISRNHSSFCPEPKTWDVINAYEHVDQMKAGYLATKRYADSHDIVIRNATRGGKLEVFPRVDFDELFD